MTNKEALENAIRYSNTQNNCCLNVRTCLEQGYCVYGDGNGDGNEDCDCRETFMKLKNLVEFADGLRGLLKQY